MSFEIDETDAQILSRYTSQCVIARYNHYLQNKSDEPDPTEIGNIIEGSVLEAIRYHTIHSRDAAAHFQIIEADLPF